ncbi:MAG: ABC transporter substrate-binding protein [Maritimibacter sp.]
MKFSTTLKAVTALTAVALAAPASAEVTIGYLSDLSGGSSALTGKSSQVAIEMAIEDFGGTVNGEEIKLLVADQLNKPDVGLGIAREWIDTEGLDMLFNVDNSAVAMAVSPLAAENNVMFITGASTTAMTNDSCEPLQIQMLMDSYGLSRAITIPLVEQGLSDWYFITIDYAFGKDLEAKGVAAIEAAGGNIVGSVAHPPAATDYSAYLLEAQAKGASTIGMATFGPAQIAIVKQASEFGIDLPKVPYFMSIEDIKSAGIENLQGVQGAIQFYWDENDATRDFAKRFQERYSRPPTFTNAQAYEMVTHYLNAVQAAGSDESAAVNEKMRATPVQFINGATAEIRADGRLARPMYSYKTKAPGDMAGEWDFLELTGEVAADSLLLPLEESTCKLVK